MTSVTVDLEDLRTLVLTAGALKTIEGALASRKADPFVREHLDFTEAHNRLASAMRNAERADAGTLVPWDGDLDDAEIDLLHAIDTGEHVILTRRQKSPNPGAAMSVADQLAAKGCVVIGQLVKGILWAGEAAPDLVVDPQGFPVRITQRGREKLAKLALNTEYKKTDENMKTAFIKGA